MISLLLWDVGKFMRNLEENIKAYDKSNVEKGCLYCRLGKVLYYVEHPGLVKYKGEFSGGEFQGKGILYDENGEVVYEGEFLRGDIA